MINAVFDTVLNHYFEWQHNYVTDSLSKGGHYLYSSSYKDQIILIFFPIS